MFFSFFLSFVLLITSLRQYILSPIDSNMQLSSSSSSFSTTNMNKSTTTQITTTNHCNVSPFLYIWRQQPF